MASPGWSDIDATNAMSGVLLNALGYRQHISQLSVPITYAGIGKGQIDVFLGNWMPAQAPMVKPLIEAKSIVIAHANLNNAKFTLAVPDYVAAAGVHSFADLQKYADRFHNKIYGIEPGAPANQNIDKMIGTNAFGLAHWTLVASSETAMLTQVKRAVRNRQWIVFLAWEPHQMNTEFKLSYLDGGDTYFGPRFGASTVNTVERDGYAMQCPNVARLFQQLTFNVPIENSIISTVLNDRADVKVVAQQTLTAHPELLKTWLNGVSTLDGKDGLAAVQSYLHSHPAQ